MTAPSRSEGSIICSPEQVVQFKKTETITTTPTSTTTTTSARIDDDDDDDDNDDDHVSSAKVNFGRWCSSTPIDINPPSHPPKQQQQRKKENENGGGGSGGSRFLAGKGQRPFYGRQQELENLHSIYHEFISSVLFQDDDDDDDDDVENLLLQQQRTTTIPPPTTTKRAVFITGVSGCGKTALFQQFIKEQQQQQQQQVEQQQQEEQTTTKKSSWSSHKQQQQQQQPPYVMLGKYEEMKRQDPFSALEQAFGNYISRNTFTNKEKKHIIKTIGGEAGLDVLKDIIPALSSWAPPPPAAAAATTTTTTTTTKLDDDDVADRNKTTTRRRRKKTVENSFKSNQLHYVFGKLIDALTTRGGRGTKTTRPLILVQDDIQWADSASLDLLSYLITSPTLIHCPLFVIGTYRPESIAGSVHDSCLLDKTKDFSYNISLNNHSKQDILELLCREMNCTNTECMLLATTIYNKTNGNFLFTLHVMEDLQRQGLLRKHHRHRRHRSGHHQKGMGGGQHHQQQQQQHHNSTTGAAYASSTAASSSCHSNSDGGSSNSPKNNSNDGNTKSISLEGEETLHTWDSDDIIELFVKQSYTNHTIIDAVSDKIRHITDPKVKQALILASFLGSQFDVSTLHALFQHYASTTPGTTAASAGEKDYIIHSEDGSCCSSSSNTDPIIISLPPTSSSLLLSRTELVKALDVAVLEGLLNNSVGSDTYQFSHDRVQEAASNMIPFGPERDQMLFDMGYFLKKRATTAASPFPEEEECPQHQPDDRMLFVAVRHWREIDSTQRSNYVDPVDFANLCLKCGMKSISMTAFEEAATYFRLGIESLLLMRMDAYGGDDNNNDDNLWSSDEHYDLTLKLYRFSAEMELLLGNYECGYALGNTVIQNAKTLLEKIPTYDAMDTALGLQERHAEALEVNLEVLKQLDEVPSVWYGIQDFFQVKNLIKNTSDEEILSLPEFTDPKALATIRCLGNVATRAFICGNMIMMITVTLKTVKLVLKHGLCPTAPVIFAGYGCALLSGMGHPKTGSRMGRLARKIMNERNFTENEGKTLYIVGSLIDLWGEPFSSCIETFERAHKVGLMSGNLEYGFSSEVEAILASFVTGRSLVVLSGRCQRLLKQVRQHKNEALTRILQPLGSVISQLSSPNTSSTSDQDGSGYVDSTIAWEDFCLSEELQSDLSNQYTLAWASLYGIILSYLMGNSELAKQLTTKFHSVNPPPSFHISTLGNFFSGLVHSKLAHQSQGSNHKTLVRKHTKEMKKLVERGCKKNSAKHSILKAECLGLEKPHKQFAIQQLYDEAICLSNEDDCIPDQALANELAGEYFLRQKRSHSAKDYLIEACCLYTKWGAESKVTQLLRKHSSYITIDDIPQEEPAKYVGFEDFAGSSIEGSIISDDMSALTPIFENEVMTRNRWKTDADATSSRQDAPNCPPKMPQRT